MKININKWLIFNSNEVDSYILYEDISAFQIRENKKQIIIFLRGVEAPLTFGFDTNDALKKAYNTMFEHFR